ncbi:MAG: IclR family transcriptional regulator [Nocardioidaceae bacterium]|nr:IclR family transcriptional regulator [Nocardioidaceae bacterium]
MSNKTGAGNSTVQSVDRAITVLEILADSGAAGVTEIAGKLGVHKSTAFRLVAALEGRGLVEQNDERGKYRLGMGILHLAGATTASLDLVQESRPPCRALAAETNETVNLAILSDGSALYLDQVSGSSALQSHNWVGQRIPLHATSNGKVLLSGLSDSDIGRVVARPLRAYTASTITTMKGLMAAVATVRARGHALAVDEFELGLTAVAAPVHNFHGDVIASVSVSGPTFRLDSDRMSAIVVDTKRTAAAISQRLGWHRAVG